MFFPDLKYLNQNDHQEDHEFCFVGQQWSYFGTLHFTLAGMLGPFQKVHFVRPQEM